MIFSKFPLDDFSMMRYLTIMLFINAPCLEILVTSRRFLRPRLHGGSSDRATTTSGHLFLPSNLNLCDAVIRGHGSAPSTTQLGSQPMRRWRTASQTAQRQEPKSCKVSNAGLIPDYPRGCHRFTRQSWLTSMMPIVSHRVYR